jgi:transposase-like protein
LRFNYRILRFKKTRVYSSLFRPKNKEERYTHASKGTDEINGSRFMEVMNGLGDFWEAQEEAVREFRRSFIEGALEAERTMLAGCKKYKRTDERKDYRNDYWKRWITLKDGRLEIWMPRIRDNGYESGIIPRYKQRVEEVDAALLKIFLYGASTRLTGEALRPLLGEGVSAQTVIHHS